MFGQDNGKGLSSLYDLAQGTGRTLDDASREIVMNG